MKKVKMVLLFCLSIVVVLTAAVTGTLAWLTDHESAVNTFTVGRVYITVNEAKVDINGVPVPGADRVKGNQYCLIPGMTYVKDPTMTVAGDNVAAYVRMLLTINCKSQLDAIFDSGLDLTTIFNGYDATNWIYETETVDTAANTITYEFRYKEIVDPDGTDVVLDALFDSFTVPSSLDGDDLESIKDLTITVEGHAIQAAGFDAADLAWASFELQSNG